jgi:hypothetical protein
MNTETSTNLNSQTQITPSESEEYQTYIGSYRSLDENVDQWWDRFPVSMLRLARIITVKEAERWDFTAEKVVKLMDRNRLIMLASYTPLQLREQFWLCTGEIRGGGYKVEWNEMEKPHRRNDPPHYWISFTHLYLPKEVLAKYEPTRA